MRLWDVRALERPVATLSTGHDRPSALLAVASHPARPDWLATGSAAGTVAVWDVRNLAHVECAEGAVHATGAVRAIAPHPNAPTTVFSAGTDGAVGVVTFPDAAARPPTHRHLWRHVLASQLSVNAVAVSASLDVLFAGTEDGALLMRRVPASAL